LIPEVESQLTGITYDRAIPFAYCETTLEEVSFPQIGIPTKDVWTTNAEDERTNSYEPNSATFSSFVMHRSKKHEREIYGIYANSAGRLPWRHSRSS